MRCLSALALIFSSSLALATDGGSEPPWVDRYLLDLAGDGADPALQPGTDDGWLSIDGAWTSTPTRTRLRTSRSTRLPRAASGLSHVQGELTTYDANGDGRIDAADPAWAAIRIHVDADADGSFDSGETRTPGDAGVQSIGSSGHSFTRTNGTTGEILRVP